MIPVVILLTVFMNVFIPYENALPVCASDTDLPLLSKIIMDGELYSGFTYNGANLISEEKTMYQYVKHNYNDKNQLISSDFYTDFSFASSNSSAFDASRRRGEWVTPANTPKNKSESFEYDNTGRLIKSIDSAGYCTYTFDSKNRISRQTFHQADLTIYMDYIYDIRGNLIKMNQSESGKSGTTTLVLTREYEFDNKFNPYRSFKSLMIPGKNTNYNNITKETYTLHMMENQKQVNEYIYEYNGMGYPVRVNKTTEYLYK
jgi:YD repeat-containing protein